jgi:hypothetical protein
MNRALTLLTSILLAASSAAAEYRHFGRFILKSHFKITGDRITPVPIKPVVFDVATDGVHVKVTADGAEDSPSKFAIYRADGIGRQRPGDTGLDITPGLQAMSTADGVVRHLRLSAEALTLTTFPGLSNQTIVSHAVPAPAQPAITRTGPATTTTDPATTASKPSQPDPAPVHESSSRR